MPGVLTGWSTCVFCLLVDWVWNRFSLLLTLHGRVSFPKEPWLCGYDKHLCSSYSAYVFTWWYAGHCYKFFPCISLFNSHSKPFGISLLLSTPILLMRKLRHRWLHLAQELMLLVYCQHSIHLEWVSDDEERWSVFKHFRESSEFWGLGKEIPF